LLEQYKQANIPDSILSAIFYQNAEKILKDALKKQENAVPKAILALSV